MDGIRLFIVHNKKDVPKNLTDVDVVVYGHSHKHAEQMIDNILWINPGSCGKRRFNLDITMCRMIIEEGNYIIQKSSNSTEVMKERKLSMDDFCCCKLEIFIPESHLEVLRTALQSVDAGHIGNYDSCLSYSRVIGCWRPLAGTNPYLGETNTISEEPELKVEVTCLRENVDKTLAAIKRVHPYEEPVINVIPLYRTGF